MKPTEEQVLAIRQYIDRHLIYRETEDEVLDHIFTALEDVPDSIPFGEAMNSIIKNMGGLKGIALMESAAKKAAIRMLMKRYIASLKHVCLSPFIIGIVAITLPVYYLGKIFFHHFGFVLLITLMINAPSLVVKRQILSKRNLVNVKNDAFKTLFGVMGMITPFILFLSLILYWFTSAGFFEIAAPYILTAACGITILHTAVIYRLTRDEFRKPAIS